MINKLENFIIKIIVTLNSVLLLSFAFSSNQICMAQRMFLDSDVENKNQLFEVLGVRKQLTQYKNIRMNDSTIFGESSQTLYIDSSGYVTKTESFNTWFNPPKSILELKRDKNGNIIQIISDGKLEESKIYDESNKIKQSSYYDSDSLVNTYIFNYDSLGNQTELIIEYPSGKIDTVETRSYEYDNNSIAPKILKATHVSDISTDIYFYDKLEKLKKVFSKPYPYNTLDSTLYFYNGGRDSLIIYNNHFEKIVRVHDEKLRINRIIVYNQSDSLIMDSIYEFNDKGIEIRDSILIANGLEILQKPYDEMMEEQIVAKIIGNGKLIFTTTTIFFENGLRKQMIKTDYSQNRIEEITYEYEFY